MSYIAYFCIWLLLIYSQHFILCQEWIIADDKPLTATKSQQSSQIQNSNINDQSTKFSGYYKPDYRNTERYGAAWLATMKSFMNPVYIKRLRNIQNLEAVSLALVRYSGVPIMTRDYFDFQVVHLSSTTNTIPGIADIKLQESLISRMQNTIKYFASLSEGLSSSLLLQKRMNRPRYRMTNTVVLIPYTSTPASQHLDPTKQSIIDMTHNLRLMYLQACVYSISRYFPKIIITTQTITDLDAVKALNLPIWKYIDLSESLSTSATLFLPRESLVYLFEQLNATKHGHHISNDWDDIDYIYYSEMDQILHARSLKVAYDTLDRLNGTAILVPHRVNTIALPKAFEEADVWSSHRHNKDSGWNAAKLDELRNAKLVVEHPTTPRGSCCDDGRYLFVDCGNWWVNCANYGLQNYTIWLQFGKDTYTMPTGTAHRAKCQYHPQKVLCPIPASCPEHTSIPKKASDVCDEMPNAVIVPEGSPKNSKFI